MSNGPAEEERLDTDATDELPILLETAVLDSDDHRVTLAPEDDPTGEHTAHYAALSAAAEAAEIAELKSDLERRRARIHSLEHDVSQLSARWVDVERHFTAKDAQVAELNATLASLRTTLDSRMAVEERLTAEIAQRDAAVQRAVAFAEQREQSAAARERELAEHRRALAAAREEIARVNDELAAQTSQAREPADLQPLREEVAALAAYIANRRVWWDALEARAAAQAARIVELERAVAHRAEQQLRAESAVQHAVERAEAFREQLAAASRRAESLAADLDRERGEPPRGDALAAMETQLAGVEAALAAARAESEARRQALAEQHTVQVAHDGEHAVALAAANELREAQLAAASKQHAEQLAAANERHAAELAAMNDRQAAELAAMNERHAAELAAAAESAVREAAEEAPSPNPEAIARLEAEAEQHRAEIAAERSTVLAQSERLAAAAAALEAAHRQLAETRLQRDEATDHAARLERALIEKDRALDARDARIVTLQNELDQKLGALQKLNAMDLSLQGLDSKMSERLRRAEASPVNQPNTPALVCLTSDVPRQYALNKKTMTIGRSSRCDIQVLTQFVSREHARLTVTRGAVVIEDIGSTNGLFVNSTRAERQELRHGDLVTIGETQFRFLESMAH